MVLRLTTYVLYGFVMPLPKEGEQEDDFYEHMEDSSDNIECLVGEGSDVCAFGFVAASYSEDQETKAFMAESVPDKATADDWEKLAAIRKLWSGTGDPRWWVIGLWS